MSCTRSWIPRQAAERHGIGHVMSHRTWACFECRKGVRRPTKYGNEALAQVIACPQCGRNCTHLGYKIPLPPRRDEKAWASLRAELLRSGLERQERSQQAAVRSRHQTEQEIRRLEERPDNAQRARLIRELRRRLDGA